MIWFILSEMGSVTSTSLHSITLKGNPLTNKTISGIIPSLGPPGVTILNWLIATNELADQSLKSISFTKGVCSPVISFSATVVLVFPISFSKTALFASCSDRFDFSVAVISMYKSSNCLSVNHSLPSIVLIFFTALKNSSFRVTSLKVLRKLLAGSCGIPKLP